MTDFICYIGLLVNRAASEKGSDGYQGVFFSVNIFTIKQSTLLTFWRLLRIVSSGD